MTATYIYEQDIVVNVIRSYGTQIIIILLLAIGIAAGVYLVQRQQIFKPKAAETEANMDIGFAVTGLAHYGKDDLFQKTYSTDIETTLKEVSRLKGKVIRIFLANKTIDADETADRLDSLLSAANRYNISLIVSLISYYKDIGNYPKTISQYFDQEYCDELRNCTQLLSKNFFTGGYKNTYIPFIRTVVGKNQHHSNIYAWEIGNELQVDDPNVLVNFVNDAANEIRNSDPNTDHHIITGFLDARHATFNKLSANELYPKLNNKVDAISVTSYGGDFHGLSDINWAAANKKIPVIMEAGFENGHGDLLPDGRVDRSRRYFESMNTWANQRAQLYIVWGFVAKDITYDNENANRPFGMDNSIPFDGQPLHTDYDQIADVLQTWDSLGDSSKANNLVRLELSSTGRFSNSDGDVTVVIENPSTEQYVGWNRNIIYIRETHRTNNGQLQPRSYSQILDKLDKGDSFSVGNVLIGKEV